MRFSSLIFLGLLGAAVCLETSPLAAASAASRLRFTESTDGGFAFDTGVLQGRLRPGGNSLGLASLVHGPTGVNVARGHGVLGHYRVFTANRRYGTAAWDWPSTARLLEDGAVEVTWPSALERPFELKAIYRWAAATTVDLETVVRAEAVLPDFEVFLASYFESAFTNSLVSVSSPQNPNSRLESFFMHAKQSLGPWQLYPRDAAVLPLIHDGRWQLEPHPVQWSIMPFLREPLAFRREDQRGLSAVLMAPPEDCFAVATPHESESHYSLYLSLFGRTVPAGQQARARTRLHIGEAITTAEVHDRYQAYRASLR